MLVYRYEDIKGVGPYSNPALGFNTSHASKPTPQSEGILMHSNSRSAFTSFNDLDSWFSKREQVMLESSGYDIVEYEVPSNAVFLLQGQCVFLFNQAVVVEED